MTTAGQDDVAVVEMKRPADYKHWISLSEDDLRNMLIALVGRQFGPEPEKRVPEIKQSRRQFADSIADKVRLTSEDTLLDLGSGCGFATYWFAQRAKHVHACDISPAFLSFAAQECSDLPNVSFHLIQPRQLDCIAENSIDVVVAMSVFIHFNLYDIYWYFREFARIVTPGGRIWIDFADSESLHLTTPNTNGSYFLKHAADYHQDTSRLPGLMQWNSLSSIVQVARETGFDMLDSRTGGRLLFVKPTSRIVDECLSDPPQVHESGVTGQAAEGVRQASTEQRSLDNNGIASRLVGLFGSLLHDADRLGRLPRRAITLARSLEPVSQRLLSLQQQVDKIDQRLDFPYLFSLRQTANDINGTSQVVQKLLALRYQELSGGSEPTPQLDASEFRFFSQNGEDGLLLFVFSVIGTTNKKSVEICAGDGVECNTANLIINHGWTGLLFDGDEDCIRRGQDFFAHRCQDTFSRPPQLVHAWITAENVNGLVASHGFAGDIDLLSLDLDGIDYWVWQALSVCVPRAVIVEFNPAWGPELSRAIPYRSDYQLDVTQTPYYVSGSLTAWAKLARLKGYRLVGTQRLGFNAIFVRSDLGVECLPELTPAECFARNPTLSKWTSTSIPDRPEWKEAVEV